MRPICVKCHAFYKAKKNGFLFCEMIPLKEKIIGWTPYKIWSGDLYECPLCKHQLISGAGREPIAHHFDPDFQELMPKVEGSVYAP
jgi:hypothetical protein